MPVPFGDCAFSDLGLNQRRDGVAASPNADEEKFGKTHENALCATLKEPSVIDGACEHAHNCRSERDSEVRETGCRAE